LAAVRLLARAVPFDFALPADSFELMGASPSSALDGNR
jgi:hypothetical protein